MQESYAYNVNADGISERYQVHPEVAEYSEQILRRDLKLQNRSGIFAFMRRPYEDLHEEETVKWQAAEQGKELDDPLAAVIVIRIEEETNARLPCTEKQFKEELEKGEFPFFERKSRGFG